VRRGRDRAAAVGPELPAGPYVHVRCGGLGPTCWEAQGTGLIVAEDMMAEADKHARDGHHVQFTVSWDHAALAGSS
jgi:hypothetical protein